MCQQILTYCIGMFKQNSFLIACLAICFLNACALNQESQHQFSLDSIRASCILGDQDQYIITGTAKDTSSIQKHIKSPFIMVFDSTFTKLSQHYFPTATTSLNPTLIQASPTEYLLAYYLANSLEDQTEISQLQYMDRAFTITKEFSYGNRTRIKDLLIRNNDSVITLNYERASQQTSIQLVQNKKLQDHVSYSVTDQTNIPTAITGLDEKAFVIAGIANGFHHPDGHDFKNPKATGYIIRIDENGHELNRYQHYGEGHVFLHDIVTQKDTIHVVGTHQSEGTGMDQLIISLKSDFTVLSQSIVRETGIQEWLLAKRAFAQVFLAGTKEDLNDYSMNLQLQCMNKNQDVLWKKTITDSGSYKPIDMFITKSHMILLVEKTTSRTSSPESYAYQFSLDGTLLYKIKIN